MQQQVISTFAGPRTRQLIMRTLSQCLPPLQEGCTRIYLCRHGETDYNVAGILQGRGVNMRLNKNGHKQAQQLARSFKDIPLDAVYSSALARAKETAACIQHAHPTTKTGAFVDLEEMSFGTLEGTPRTQNAVFLQEIYAKWRRGILDANARFPSGECPLDVKKRGVAMLHELAAGSDDDHIAFVCHGRFNKIILAELLSIPVENPPIPQDNTCVNVLDYNRVKGTYTAVVINHTTHLVDRP
ncbi:hypothetical protein SDRG_13570 [Saprolegnia diclina VS20]|uniref:Phosphoglycerate mutase n=1 Tax=Saprolegnia diclina (strain VS20) TaxID=1156394 RepID=T0Q5I3_SAPDV|nr:hypothetical protein SDRG_13570 [Saprolegnia diclina VS20]EQC28695.1 hypothetical protein SDRG_13570 [Saprolegnia diclina VS20]|eukprot:XP_008617887.1 hypothetical protein SDRG_13570 [Saprolegnia diclina VS20]